MVKFYQREKEINGVKYVAQFSGLGAWLKCVDESYINGTTNTSTEKLSKNVLKYGLIEPSVTIDDFESMEDLQEVVNWVTEVMQGHFREEVKPKADTAKSK